MLAWLTYYVYLMTPFTLTLDRFISALFPLKYKAIFSKRRARLFVVSIWMVGLLITVPTVVLYYESRMKQAPQVALGIVIIVTAFALFSYTCIGITIRNQRRIVGRAGNEYKILKTAFIIIMTFLIFVTIPSTVVAAIAKSSSHPFETSDTVYCATAINLSIDPAVYLLGFPPLRSAVKERLLNPVRDKMTSLRRTASDKTVVVCSNKGSAESNVSMR